MKKILIALGLVLLMIVVFAIPASADVGGEPNGGNPDQPPRTIGQNWSNGTDPGLRDDVIHDSQSSVEGPIGLHWLAENRAADLIPGQAKK